MKHEVLKKILLAAMLTISAYMESMAQKTVKLTLSDCLHYAIENSCEMRKAGFEVKESDYSHMEAKGDLLPQLNGTASLTGNIKLSHMMMPGDFFGEPGTLIPVEMGSKYESYAGIDLSQVIFDASLFTGIKISKNAKDLVVLKSFMTQEELIFNIGNAFYDIVYSQSLHENNLTTLTIMDSIYRKTEMQVKQHITREIDLNRMRINISNLKVEKEKTEAIMAQQKNYLRILMGMPLETIFELADDEIFVLPENNYLADSNNIESKTELQILYNEKTGGLLEIKQLKMSYLPSLSLMASSGYTFQANELDIKNHNNWSNGTYLKLNFSIPIFDGFTKHRKIRQAQIRVNKTEEDIRQIKQNTLSDLQNAQMQLYVNSRAVKAQQENMELAGRTYRQSIMLYEEGLYGITDLLDTEKSFREAQTACDYEMVNYRKALLDLKKAEGTLQSLINKLQNK